jgi:hypothetical protein
VVFLLMAVPAAVRFQNHLGPISISAWRLSPGLEPMKQSERATRWSQREVSFDLMLAALGEHRRRSLPQLSASARVCSRHPQRARDRS